ncbi:MAG: Ni/Fe hydrogenase subunit alpha [Helicobacteraceae bacterium]|jgi:NAD-reducing hydrogenase large subunit|nr:Ni/Fe hydrogenase subunit alpha [Helicobacteraceae bacterium]
MKTITINPVTRIEGHAKITIRLNDDGSVEKANLHVLQFRGFEKFCQGRPYTEMPGLTARTCGICPVSHLISSSKAADELLAVSIPRTGANLRRIINLAQIAQSHALNFFYLSAPDLLLGFDADPSKRNVFGALEAYPEIVKTGIGIRSFGQRIIERIGGGKRIHPIAIVPGGMRKPLDPQVRLDILAELPTHLKAAINTLDWFKKSLDKYQEEARVFSNYPTLFMGLIGENGEIEHYDGKIRVIDHTGKIVADKLEPSDYQQYIGEFVEEESYLKSPYYKPIGYPKGVYRVGPLARLNISDKMGTPVADEEFAEFRQIERGPILSGFYYHYARLIEIIYAFERIGALLNDEEILSPHIRARAEPNRFEGVGMSEAPRGVLLHHYKIDKNGLIEWINMIIASGHNNLAMNRGVEQAAKRFVDGNHILEGALNRVEAVIRAFDPCLSCSTHALGKMPMRIELYDHSGVLIDEKSRV